MSVARWLWRWRMERVLLGRGGARGRAWLRGALASDPALCEEFDRACVGLRALEGRSDGWSEVEASLVEANLFDQRGLASSAEARAGRGSWWLVSGSVVVSAVLAAIWLMPRPEGLAPGVKPLEGYVGARGDAGAQRGLALEALCGPPMIPAAEGCDPGSRLTFAYELLDPALAGAQLVLFGVDDAGRTLYYQPSPVDTAPLRGQSGRWRATGFSVRLDVNHRPGPVRIFALAYGGEAAIDHARVDGWARALAASHAGVAEEGPMPWHERLGAGLGLDCEHDACASAETLAQIEER